jgi:hypothetical protein
MRLAYGLKVAAVLIAGGTAIYYAPGPRLTVTAPDIVELAEGINERRAAVGTWPFTGDTNGWSFTAFTTMGGVLPIYDLWYETWDHALDGDVAMRTIMEETILLAPSFVKEHSPTNVVMWTAPALFKACGVGPADGTQTLYTVGVETNGTRVYSNWPSLNVWTGLLWECYRLQVAMTTTVKSISWDSNATVRRMQTAFDPKYTTNTVYEPAWYTACTNTGALDDVPSPEFQRLRGITIPTNFAQTGTAGAGGPRESIEGSSAGDYAAYYISGGGWLIRSYLSGALDWKRSDLTNSVTFRFPSLATGCTFSVDYRIPVIGNLTITNLGQGATSWHYGFTNALTTNFACVGVSTGWWQEITLPVVAHMGLVYDGWTNYLPATDSIGKPTIEGSISATLPNYLFVNWTFTRCRP